MSGSHTLPSSESLNDVIGAEADAYPEGQTPGRTTVYEGASDSQTDNIKTDGMDGGIADGTPGNTMMTEADTLEYAKKHGEAEAKRGTDSPSARQADAFTERHDG